MTDFVMVKWMREKKHTLQDVPWCSYYSHFFKKKNGEKEKKSKKSFERG